MGDRAALNRRAERFRREHEIEKQKQNGGGGQASSLRASQRNAHPFVNLSRSATPFANADDPEADPVSVLSKSPLMMTHHTAVLFLQNVPNWDQHTIVGTSQEIFKDYLRLTSVRVIPYPSGLSEVSVGPRTQNQNKYVRTTFFNKL